MSFSAVTVVRPYEQIVRQIQQAIRDNARRFAPERFHREITALILDQAAVRGAV